MDRTISHLQRGIEQGLHVGAQLYVLRAGSPAMDIAVGIAREGVAMTSDTLMLWQSSTKPVAAVAIGQLWQRKLLQLDDPVGTFIPEFAVNGKEPITIRHLLTHTGGFRGALLGWSNEPWTELVARICAGRVETGWVPGKKAGYHVGSSWIILGELVRRIDGRPFEVYAREAIFAPARMPDSWVGMPPDVFARYGDRIALMHDTTGPAPLANFPNDTPEGCALCRPHANGHGPARDLANFYEALRLGFSGRSLLLWPQTLEAMVSRQRVGMFDQTFRQVVDWGLGFMVDNNLHGIDKVPYPFSRHSSARTFGHGGSQSSVGFCDPEFELAVGLIFNGCPGEAAHHVRIRETLGALYEDLGLRQT